MEPGVGITASDGVAHATIDRGPGNVLTTEDCAALLSCLREPPAGVRLLRLSARGPSFCLGRERRAATVSEVRAEVRTLIELNEALSATPLTTVAEVQGDAAGYGVGLAALCDVAFAAPSARFWFPEIELGLPPVVVLAWLPRIVGRRQAFLLTATGRKISAAEAAALGLVSDVVSSDAALGTEVDTAVQDLLTADARVAREVRRFLNETAEMPLRGAYALAEDRLVVESLILERTTGSRR